MLVVDADPQGNTSSGLGVRVKEKTPTVYEVMAGETPIEQALCKTAVQGPDGASGGYPAGWRGN